MALKRLALPDKTGLVRRSMFIAKEGARVATLYLFGNGLSFIFAMYSVGADAAETPEGRAEASAAHDMVATAVMR